MMSSEAIWLETIQAQGSPGDQTHRAGVLGLPGSASPPDSIRVFLLDDQEVVREGMRAFIGAEDDLQVVGEAATVDEALDRIPATRPDVAVLDVRLPDGDGVDVCREIRSRWPQVECIMFTSFCDEEALFAAIVAGAAGYLQKETRWREVAEAIRRVGSGQSILDPVSTRKVLEHFRGAGTQADTRYESLTNQERRILELVAEGLTNRLIAQRMDLSEKTVKNYVSKLLAKLGIVRRTEAAVFAARRRPAATTLYVANTTS